MYAYRKSMPRLNKHLDDKWVKHCQRLHKQKLKQVAYPSVPSPTLIPHKVFCRGKECFRTCRCVGECPAALQACRIPRTSGGLGREGE
jgi:hypothetical protein